MYTQKFDNSESGPRQWQVQLRTFLLKFLKASEESNETYGMERINSVGIYSMTIPDLVPEEDPCFGYAYRHP